MIHSFIIKPTHRCNFSCTYCYNEDTREEMMSPSTLEGILSNCFLYALKNKFPIEKLEFIWHGGEPLLMGLDFYKNVLELQEKYAKSATYTNSIQTNGYLLDDDWLSFIQANHFSLSVSIDGPEMIHNQTRVCKGDPQAFDRIIKNLLKAKELDIPTGICIVISKANVSRMQEVFQFVIALGIHFNPIPIVLAGSAKKHQDSLSITPLAYATAWMELFDLWFESNTAVMCSDFLFKIKAMTHGRPFDCVSSKNCSLLNLSFDEHGSVFPCATLSGDQQMEYGNIHHASLIEIMQGDKATRILHRQQPSSCQKCQWQPICNAGCFARAYKFTGKIDRAKDYYCKATQLIYQHLYTVLTTKAFEAHGMNASNNLCNPLLEYL